VLRERVAALNARLSQLEESAVENRRLHSLLGFREMSSYELEPVRVVAREPSQRLRSVVIDGGKRRGVTPFMPVVNADGLVGKVVHVLPYMSLVQLLPDPLNRTSVTIRPSRVVGVLETENGIVLFVRCRTHAEVDSGDTVVTSGLGGIYPKGLFVGTVRRLAADEDPLFVRAVVDPFVRFNRLEEAFVMRLSAQWAAFRGELDSLGSTP
jgi:rod shape-determining protein MreC